jgi:hypothetical protein
MVNHSATFNKGGKSNHNVITIIGNNK